MRILHTSDWHVGKTIRGASRLDEHRRVLAELAELAADQRVDAVLVVGDVFESAAPPPDAQRVAWEALLALRATGAEVVVVAGNHDHAEAFEAVRPVFTQLGIHVVGLPARPDAGGLLEFGVRDERLRVALLPWVARQHAIRALQLMELEGAEAVQHYADRVRHMIDRLCATFRPDAVNVIAAHAYVRGGMGGGGERVTHLIEEYFVTPASFPATASYVALGHLHRRQRIDAGVPVWYCGSPIQVDFGDDSDPRGAIVVEATAGLPPRVEFVALSTPARLATIRGSLAELPSLAAASGADYLRVVVDEPARPGLADEVRAVVPNAVDIGIVPPRRASLEPPSAHDHAHRSPHDLFVDYLDSAGADRDPALLRLFDDLHEEAILP